VGKAARAMARAAEETLDGRLGPGLAVGVDEDAPGPRRILFRTAGHPLPDRRGLAAARQVETLARGLRRADVLLVLLSGGASALLPAPAPGLTLADKVETTRLLLEAGADIESLNAVRKHLSRLKGGGLARLAHPARVVALALSDVVGDDLSVIASGPTVPDPTRYVDAGAVLHRHRLWSRVPPRVRRRLEAGRAGRLPETPKPGDPVFRRVTTSVLAGAREALAAAARAARRAGFETHVVTRTLRGEARDAGADLAHGLLAGPFERPACRLAAGETTVRVRGPGVGGRNLELAVAAARPLAGRDALLAAFATDGRDGASRSAGGVVTGSTLERARRLGLADPEAFLDVSDAESYLAPLGDLIVTGPTGTNVADLVVMLAGPLRDRQRL
jgi:hydroxypyruvate reductase